MRKLDTVLDAGHGDCPLRQTEARQRVMQALHYFENARCLMLAYAVMPNHVHALFRPFEGHSLQSLAGSWKANSTRQLNAWLGRRGSIWQQETFDRIIRDAEHYQQAIRYIANNPAKANLATHEASVWFCSAIREANGWEDNDGT